MRFAQIASAEKEVTDRMQGHILAYRGDRLGARLNAIANTVRLSRKYGFPFSIYWLETDEGADAAEINAPEEIFSAEFIEKHFISRETYMEHRRKLVQVPAFKSIGDFQDFASKGGNIVVLIAYGAYPIPGEDADEVLQEYKQAFEELPLNPALQERKQELDRLLQGMTAYHIRRGDITSGSETRHRAWPIKCIPDEFYVTHMREKLGSGSNIMIFSDEAHTVERFKGLFPQLQSLSDLIDVSDLTRAQYDMIEFYAMSRCETVIAPERSAFSSAATTLGRGTKFDVKVDLTPAQSDASHEALIERIRDEPDSFPNPGEIAQMFVHLSEWAREKDKVNKIVPLERAFLEEGHAISFVFPLLMHDQISVGDLDGLRRTGQLAKQSFIRERRAVSETLALRAISNFRDGNTALGLELAVNAVSHSFRPAISRALIFILLDRGLLNEKNFLPIPTDIRRLTRQSLSFDQNTETFELMRKLFEFEEFPKGFGGIRALQLDWADFFPEKYDVKMIHHNYALNVARRAFKLRTPENRAFGAYYLARSNELDAPTDYLQGLAKEAPDDAYVHFKLARQYQLDGDLSASFESAIRAVEAAPDVPAYKYWASIAAQRLDSPNDVIALLNKAVPEAPALSRVLFDAARYLISKNKFGRALDLIQRMKQTMPRYEAYVLLEAQALSNRGEHDAALSLVEAFEAEGHGTEKTYVMLAKILLRDKKNKRALQAARTGIKQFGETKQLTNMLERASPADKKRAKG